MRTRLLAHVWLAAAVVLLPRAAAAQGPARTFAELKSQVRAGQPVAITTDKVRIIGRLISVDAGRLEVDGTEQPRSVFLRFFSTSIGKTGRIVVTEAAVRKIKHDDPVWNGELIGGIIGGALFGIAYASGPNHTGEVDLGPIPVVAGGAFLGWAYGGVIDMLRHKTLFESAKKPGTVVAPLVGRGRIGVEFRLALRKR